MILSRAIGIARELVIAFAFGFSAATDLFFQAMFPLTCVMMVMLGPFTTAFAARLAVQDLHLRRQQLRRVESQVLGVACLGIGISGLAAVGLGLLPFAYYQKLSLPVALLSPAIGATIAVGYFSAVSTASGQVASAAIGYLATNAAFLSFALAASLVVSVPPDWLLPLSYALAMILALVPSYLIYAALRRDLPVNNTDMTRKLPIEGLGKSFAFALSESGVFLFTQFVILVIASSEGVGVASAAALSQRICFSVNGLFVLPFSSLVMLRMIESTYKARSVFLKTVVILLLMLLAVGGVLLLIIPPIVQHVLAPDAAALLTSLLQPFAFWVLPLGLNAFLCRIMFGLELVRPYTAITICGYVIANLARVTVIPFGGLGSSIFAGAAIESVLSLVLFLVTLRHLQKENRST